MKKVLIAEDDPRIRELYQLFCTEEEGNAKIIFAKNGQETLDFVKKERPDVLLLDMILPDMDGIDILKKLKKSGDTKKIKIFVSTNLSDDKNKKEALALGAKGYLLKADISHSTMENLIKNGEISN